MVDTETSSKRERGYIISFPNVSQREAELILGFTFETFYSSQISIEEFITSNAPELLKKKIFERLIDCIESKGFPEATILPLNESVITDNVNIVLQAMVSYFKRTMKRKDFRLSREEQMISKDEEDDENIEFNRIQKINVNNTLHVIVVETKSNAIGKGLTQLLLALKSIWDTNNDQKLVYGLLTTAINWQLVIFDGRMWKLSTTTTLITGSMANREDQWLKNNTEILDAIYSILLGV